MTEDEREQIIALATAHHLAAERVRMLQMVNAAADPDARLQQSIDYELAVVAEREARAALDIARIVHGGGAHKR